VILIEGISRSRSLVVLDWARCDSNLLLALLRLILQVTCRLLAKLVSCLDIRRDLAALILRGAHLEIVVGGCASDCLPVYLAAGHECSRVSAHLFEQVGLVRVARGTFKWVELIRLLNFLSDPIL